MESFREGFPQAEIKIGAVRYRFPLLSFRRRLFETSASCLTCLLCLQDVENLGIVAVECSRPFQQRGCLLAIPALQEDQTQIEIGVRPIGSLIHCRFQNLDRCFRLAEFGIDSTQKVLNLRRLCAFRSQVEEEFETLRLLAK